MSTTPARPASAAAPASAPDAARSRDAERLLVVGPAWVGDMVISQSLFKWIKERMPDARIEVAAPAWTAPLLERMPEVDGIIPVPLGHGQLGLAARWRIGRGLRARAYDRALVLPGSWKSAIIPWAARARRRTGFLGELRWGLLNDIRPLDRQRLPRTVDRFIALALTPGAQPPAQLPLPRLRTDPRATQAALQRLQLNSPAAPVLGLCPGAEYGPAKRWPPEHFAAVAKSRLERGWQVWLFGSQKDAAVTAQVRELTGGRCVDLGGRTQLTEAIDLMALTSVIVTNDSGLMHVAAALDRPVIAIFGSSSPGFTPPLSTRATTLSLGLECSPCFARECRYGHYRCLTELGPERVIEVLDACPDR